MGGSSRAARDWALRKQAAQIKTPEVIWTEDEIPANVSLKSSMQAAAE
jgi:multidrug efflux pump